VEHAGVVILGPLNLPAGAPLHASEMYARNVFNFGELLLHDGALAPDFNDELVAKSCVSHAGEVRFTA
jgi:NAD(P) transhydrogenase subunit alpha